MVRVVGTGIRYVIQYIVAVKFVAFGDGKKALGTKSALSVNVQAFAFAATLTDWKLEY